MIELDSATVHLSSGSMIFCRFPMRASVQYSLQWWRFAYVISINLNAYKSISQLNSFDFYLLRMKQ